MPNENAAIAIARQVPGVDVILMGHTHREVGDLFVNGVLLTQANRWASHVARVDLYLEKDGSNRWHMVAKSARTIPVTEKTEIDPQIASREYEDRLNVLATERGESIYRHDLILLGLGDDGHTASLFPGTAGLEEKRRKVIANFVPKLNSWRLTFSFPLINAARHICFLVDANKGADLIERVIEGDRGFPASHVNPAAGKVTWIIGQ